MPRSARSSGFDGLRALAALSVLVYHVLILTGHHGRFAANLYFGVPIFFVLSGYLLYRPFVAARQVGGPAPRVVPYAVRRLARIVPAYWFAMVVLAVGPLQIFTADWWRYFGFIQNMRDRTVIAGLGPAWSICVELAFYVTLPAIAWAIGTVARRRPGMALELAPLAVLGLVDVALHVAAAPVSLAPSAWLTQLPTTLLWFAAGMALAVVSVHRGQLPAIASARFTWPLAGLCFVAAGALMAPGLPFTTSHGAGVHVLLAAAAALIVLPAAAQRGSGWLDSPVMVYLGSISFGIYLWHAPIVGYLSRYSDQVTWVGVGVASLACTLVGASVSWFLVERPIIQASRRVRRRDYVDVDASRRSSSRMPAILDCSPAAPPASR
jgi:peptidoglycan/LPS O-acetylase OafA/YrhL